MMEVPISSAPATTAVDLSDGDQVLTVDISDALSERDWVKFTVHTRTTLTKFTRQEFSVIRLHEEFIWLHDTFAENPDYAGYIIPPPPPRPDFDASREKLRKLGDAEGNLTREEFNKMKQELEAEYLATFKKTVAMHETFLCRLATHPIFRSDPNLAIFLEYEKDLNVRGKNKKEKLVGILSSFQKTSDELLLGNTLKDVDEFFEKERQFLVSYHSTLKECTIKADRMTTTHKSLADNFIKISAGLIELSTCDSLPAALSNENSSGGIVSAPSGSATNSNSESTESDHNSYGSNGERPTSPLVTEPNHQVHTLAPKSLELFLARTADVLEKIRRIEGRVAADQDLKLSDMLRYHQRETQAAKDLLFRRLRCLANYENANKALEKARARNKDIIQAESEQQEACQMFEKMSERARDELRALKSRRVASIQKSLSDLAELELKHSKAHAQMLKVTIASLKADL